MMIIMVVVLMMIMMVMMMMAHGICTFLTLVQLDSLIGAVPTIPFELPDGSVLEVDGDRLRVPELYFDPTAVSVTLIPSCITTCKSCWCGFFVWRPLTVVRLYLHVFPRIVVALQT